MLSHSVKAQLIETAPQVRKIRFSPPFYTSRIPIKSFATPTKVLLSLLVSLRDGADVRVVVGETYELCRWTVDLAALPSYHRIAQNGGGYVEFDLGLELDSAEVRGASPRSLHFLAFEQSTRCTPSSFLHDGEQNANSSM